MMVDLLREGFDPNGRAVAPIQYVDGFEEMYEKLKARPPPEIALDRGDPALTITGRTFPLELFFKEIGLVRDGMAWVSPDASDADELDAMTAAVVEMAESYGWTVTCRDVSAPPPPPPPHAE